MLKGDLSRLRGPRTVLKVNEILMAATAFLQHVIPTTHPFCVADSVILLRHTYGLYGVECFLKVIKMLGECSSFIHMNHPLTPVKHLPEQVWAQGDLHRDNCLLPALVFRFLRKLRMSLDISQLQLHTKSFPETHPDPCNYQVFCICVFVLPTAVHFITL